LEDVVSFSHLNRLIRIILYLLPHIHLINIHDLITSLRIIGLSIDGILPAYPFIFTVDRDKVETAVEEKLFFFRCCGVHDTPRFFIDFEHA